MIDRNEILKRRLVRTLDENQTRIVDDGLITLQGELEWNEWHGELVAAARRGPRRDLVSATTALAWNLLPSLREMKPDPPASSICSRSGHQ